MAKIKAKLEKICAKNLKLLEEKLVLTARYRNSKVFYSKMNGDYDRYLAKFKTGHDRKAIAENTLTAYKFVQ
ncbi:hypothetical protein J1N35_040574, partial [Gossypium stocksii]